MVYPVLVKYPDSKIHGAKMGPIWGRQDPGGPHVGLVNLAIWVMLNYIGIVCHYPTTTKQKPITQTQDKFSLADAAWKHPKYPCFCILPLEFEVNIDIHKDENSEIIYSNHNKSPKEMFGNSALQKHGKHINRIYLTEYTG